MHAYAFCSTESSNSLMTDPPLPIQPRPRRWSVIAAAVMMVLLPSLAHGMEFDAREFGAVADGSHDDGPALRRMFAADHCSRI